MAQIQWEGRRQGEKGRGTSFLPLRFPEQEMVLVWEGVMLEALFHAGPGLVWSIISHQDIVNPFKLAKPKPLIRTIPTFSKFTSKLIISASYDVCHVKKEPCVGGAWKGSRSWQDARRRERSQGISWKLRLWGKTVQGEGFLLRRKSPRKVLQERKRMA